MPAALLAAGNVRQGLDLATKLRVFQRALRGRVERRDALLEIVRAINTTLEPPKIADILVERAATWIPAPCWAVVSSDLSGQLSVLADRGLMPDMGPAVYAIAAWVMRKGRSSSRPISARRAVARTTPSVRSSRFR